MGYYTNFDISSNKEEICDAIEDASGYNWYARQMEGKWYEFEKDCRLVSEKFPDDVIKLEGVGEEQDDQWVAYFKNGKMQMCRAIITFEPFDENKLK